jgi:hypothetical protein
MLVYPAHSIDITLNNQSLTTSVTMAVWTKRAFQYSPLLIGPKVTTKTGIRVKRLSVPSYINQKLSKDFADRQRKLTKTIAILQS